MVSLILVQWTGSTVSQEGRGEGRANDNLLWINKLLVDYLPGKISVDEMIILFIQQSRLEVFQAKSLVYSWKRWLFEVSWIWVQSYVANLHMALFSTSPATQLQKKQKTKNKKNGSFNWSLNAIIYIFWKQDTNTDTQVHVMAKSTQAFLVLPKLISP